MKKSIFLTLFLSFGLIFMFSGCSKDETAEVVGEVTKVVTQNTVPTANTQTITVAQDSTDNNITLSASDADGDTLMYTLETNTTNGTLSGIAPNLIYIPTPSYSGSDSFTFKVNDSTVDSEIVTIDITVEAVYSQVPVVNETPIAKAGTDQNITEGDDVTFDASSSTDDGTIESYVWSENTTQLNQTVSFTISDFTVGTHTITLAVTDNQGATATDEVTITVNAVVVVNQNPIAKAGTDQNITEGDEVTFNASSSTDDGSIVSYIWSENTTQLSSQMSFTKSDFTVGTHTITLSVTDNQSATDTDEVIIRVNAPANLVPVSSEQNVTTDENVDINITLSATDGDATDTLTYTVVTNPSNGTLSGSDANLTYTPNTDYNGTDSLTFKVNDGTIDSNTATVNITINYVGIVHNGTFYDTITSPYTQKIWLDRNLGALQVCTALDDTACYGDYYQWGRNYDGHQESNSTITTTQAIDINNSGADFITSGSYPYDWTALDSNGSLRISNWSKTDGSSVCPTGFRVPTTTELRAETLDNNESDPFANNTDAFTNFLKLPSAGYRSYSGSMGNEGSLGIVWSSSVSGSYSYYLDFYSSYANAYYSNHSSGFSVRCLKD